MLQSIKLKLQFGQLNITTNKAVSLRINCFLKGRHLGSIKHSFVAISIPIQS